MIRPISFGGRERRELLSETKTSSKTDIAKLNRLLRAKPEDFLEAYYENGEGNGVRLIRKNYAERIESTPKSIETAKRIGTLETGKIVKKSWELTFNNSKGGDIINDLIVKVNIHLRGITGQIANRAKNV